LLSRSFAQLFAGRNFQAGCDVPDLRGFRTWDFWLTKRGRSGHDLRRLKLEERARPISLGTSTQPKTGESEINISPRETKSFALLVVSY